MLMMIEEMIEDIEKAIKYYGHCRFMCSYSCVGFGGTKLLRDKWIKNGDDTLDYLKKAIIGYGRECAKKEPDAALSKMETTGVKNEN